MRYSNYYYKKQQHKLAALRWRGGCLQARASGRAGWCARRLASASWLAASWCGLAGAGSLCGPAAAAIRRCGARAVRKCGPGAAGGFAGGRSRPYYPRCAFASDLTCAICNCHNFVAVWILELRMQSEVAFLERPLPEMRPKAPPRPPRRLLAIAAGTPERSS